MIVMKSVIKNWEDMISMDYRLKFVLGILFCLIGAIILFNSLLHVIFIPGGFISLAIGIMLILDSRKPQ